ncbi:hypothetical protein F5Y18DRAFT_395307 [Xylariaceae sp. FL1019]|nr:hypothetical protein F5Y18DRAFT_395307 [Xylariaceae sp. FL1019]
MKVSLATSRLCTPRHSLTHLLRLPLMHTFLAAGTWARTFEVWRMEASCFGGRVRHTWWLFGNRRKCSSRNQ